MRSGVSRPTSPPAPAGRVPRRVTSKEHNFTISSPTHNEGPLQTHVRDEAADHAAAGRWPGRRAGVVPPRLRRTAPHRARALVAAGGLPTAARLHPHRRRSPLHRLWHLPARQQAHQSRETEQKCATRAGVRGKGEFEARGAPWRAPRDAGRGRPTPRGARDAKSTARPSAARSAARRRAAADAT